LEKLDDGLGGTPTESSSTPNPSTFSFVGAFDGLGGTH